MYSKQLYELLEFTYKKKNVSNLTYHVFYPLLLEETSFLPLNAKIRQRLWHVQNNTKEVPKCKICVKGVNWIDGKYRTYCSIKCMNNAPEVQEKKKQKCFANHGVENPQQSTEIKEKKKQTMFKRHGVEYPLQSEKIKENTRQTHMEVYGVEYPKQIYLTKFCLEKINDYSWLHEQYFIKKRTVNDIAYELKTSVSTISRHLKKFGFNVRPVGSYSYKAVLWIEFIMKEQNIFIQHAQNIGEYRISNTRFFADGYCKETNTIYEFYGDLWHGNPNMFESDYNFLYQTAGERYHNTIQRENKIKSLGYNLISIWENEWNEL